MLKIRLKRLGRKNNSTYKIVLMPALAKRDGKSIKDLGYYNSKTKQVWINKPLIFFYLAKGAYPTNTVRNLILKLLR